MTMLRLSSHIHPQLRQGIHFFTPQNLCEGGWRVAYIERIVSQVNGLVRAGKIDAAKRMREDVTFASRLTLWKPDAELGRDLLHAIPELANHLSFVPDEVGVLFRDGRTRDDSAMAYLPSATATPDVLELLRMLFRGVDRATLMQRAEVLDVGFDEELLDDLLARGVIELGEARRRKH